jgi:hypothetical protein
MLNFKNLVWAIYKEDAMFLQGWLFSKECNLLQVLTDKLVKCKNFEELRELLFDFERMIKGEIPRSEQLWK